MLTTLGSPRKRTISGNSAETTSLGGASTLDIAVSLTNLTSPSLTIVAMICDVTHNVYGL